MSRRGKVRLASFAAALVVSLAAAVVACHVGAGGYTTRLDAQTTRAFGEASSAVSRLQRSLDACAFAVDAPMQSALCTQLYADAEAAEAALSALPVEMDALENISRQIAVAGDYAYLLSRTAAQGTVVSSDNLSVLTGFSETAQQLSKQLDEIRLSFSQGELVTESRARLMDSLSNLEAEAESTEKTLNDSFHELAASFPETEPLVYDGKFSDHTHDEPRMLIGKAIIPPEEERPPFCNVNPLHCSRSTSEAGRSRAGVFLSRSKMPSLPSQPAAGKWCNISQTVWRAEMPTPIRQSKLQKASFPTMAIRIWNWLKRYLVAVKLL